MGKDNQQTYTEDRVIDGIRLIANKIFELEQKQDFCRQHNMNMEALAVQGEIAVLSQLRSKIQSHFGLLGLYIKPSIE